MFNHIIGNERIKSDLSKSIENNKVSHSYLFVGNKGIGKSLFAKEFAKAILCEKDQEKPCLECKSCKAFDDDNHPDFYRIGLEEKEMSIKIETVRTMQARVQELPITSKRKVYMIDDCEFMTKEAQNCLLKTIEEPPEFVTIILITSNENRILSTIQSRCIKLYFQTIDQEQLRTCLQTQYGITNISENKLRAYGGSIGKALQMEENKDSYHQIEEVFNKLENYTLPEAIKKLEVLYKEKEYAKEMLDYINVIFLNKAKENSKYLLYIEKVEEVKKNLNLNCNYDMCIDSLLFEIFT